MAQIDGLFRLRVLILVEAAVLILMTLYIYGTHQAVNMQPENNAGTIWGSILLFLTGSLGLILQIIGLYALFIGRLGARHFFLLGVVMSALSSAVGNGGMTGNTILALLGLTYWLLAGGILGISYTTKVSSINSKVI